MLKKLLLFSCLALSMVKVKAAYIPVALTGFNADVVANGTGTAASSTSSTLPAASSTAFLLGNFALMAPDFNPAGTTPTSFLPASGIINSASTPGLSWTLQSYSGNNALFIVNIATDSLVFTTPTATGEVAVLASAPDAGPSGTAVTMTVNFTDGSSEAFTRTVNDWYNVTTGVAIQGLGRVSLPGSTTASIDNAGGTNPRLYEYKLALSTANYSKNIRSIKFAKTATGAELIVMGISVNTFCATPIAQPTALTINTGATAANISYTAASPVADRYLIVRTPGVPLNANPQTGITYAAGNPIGNGVVVANITGTSFTEVGLSASTSYTYTVFAFNNSNCSGGPTYDTVGAPTATVLTKTAAVYTWNGAIGTDWTTPANWTPVRTVADPTDVLRFTDGLVDTAKNIPSQTINKLLVANNTSVYLQAAATTAATLTITDTVAATTDLDINAGSSLYSNGTGAALTIAFSGANNTVNIAGRMESISTSVNNVFNFANTTATVVSTGVLASGGTNGGLAITNTTAANLQINGLYDYKYTSTNPALPQASWNTNSTLAISAVTSATGGPNGGQNQSFYNFIYNCPNQTSNTNWSGTGATTVLNNFNIVSTGTGTWQFATTQAYTANIKNFSQTGGTFDIAGGNTTNAQLFNITGNFAKTAGTFKATNTTGQPTLNFTGTTNQNVSVDASPTGRIWYRVSNNAGITLAGTGSLTTFAVNDNGGIRISTTAAAPITTGLTITYGTTGSSLVYDTAGSYAMTANVFPATAGPQNLTVNLGSNTNLLTMPFSRTIPGTLTMSSGDINLGSNTLTLGTSAAAAGTLTYTNGPSIRLTTGTFTRWYGITGLPTAAGTGAGFYPIAFGAVNRNVAVSFDAATGLSAGGTISVGHTSANGLATVSVGDPTGTYTIERRTNAFWTVNAGNGLALAGTNKIKMQLTGSALFASLNSANLRVMQAGAVAGTHVNGSGSTALRKDLLVADLNNTNYYIGAALTDIGGVYIAINTGNWSAGTTWDVGVAPGLANEAYINPGVAVTVDAPNNIAKSLTIFNGGTLTATLPANTLTIDSAILNSGTINIGGGNMVINGGTGNNGLTNNVGSVFNQTSGVLTIGPANGSNKRFTHANGNATISGGNLNLNGNLNISGGSFNQSGGTILIDGNSGTAATSVPSGTHLCVISPSIVSNFNGGTLLFVDPPHSTYASGSTRTLNLTSTNANVIFGGTHLIQIGDGVSTTAGNVDGFVMETFSTGNNRVPVNHVTVNAGSVTGRWMTGSFTNSTAFGFHMRGNLTINAGSEVRTALATASSSEFNVGGNILNNGTFTSLATRIIVGGNTAIPMVPVAAQTISGTGIFQNAATGSTANLRGITVNNSNGVTINSGDLSFSGTVTFQAGASGPTRIIMPGTSRLIEIGGAGQSGAGQSTGWVHGRYQKAAAIGGMNHNFPIGDATTYATVNVSGTALTAGAIWASTTAGDHPSLNTSTLNPLATVNRYYTIDTTGGLTFTAGTMSTTLNWAATDIDPYATTTNFAIGNYKGSTWAYPTFTTPLPTSIKATGQTGDVVGQYVVGEPCGTAVTIANQPVDKTGCAGSALSLSVSASPRGGATYQWKKGTTVILGATDSIYTIPALSAADAGSYTVTIGSGCASVPTVISNAVVVTVNAPATITTQPAAITDVCSGSPATFSVAATGTGITYQWKKNGAAISGATASSYTIPTASAADTANYTVDVMGTSPCGNVTSAISKLTIKPVPSIITAGGTINFCPGGSVVLNGPVTTPTNTLTYVWNVNGSPISPAQNGQTYIATTTGSYTATITNTANGCSGVSNAILVNVNGAPQSVITPAGTTSFCQGSSVLLHGLSTPGLTYEWYLNGNTATVLGTDSTYAAGVAGSYTVKISIGSGCSTTSAPTVVSALPVPTITTTPVGAQTICQNDTLVLTAFYNNANLVWKFNGNPITPAATGSVYKAYNAGTYTVTATSTTNGCQNTSAPVSLAVNPLPVITTVSANASTFCAGGTDTLKATPRTGLTYVWSRGATPIAPAANDTNYVALISGSYTVTGTNANGCKATSTPIVVTVNPLPGVVVTPSLPLTICSGQTNNLCVPAAAGLTYQWSDASGPITGATGACLAATTAGTYSVKVTNATTGCNATSTASTIVVNPIPASVITVPARTTACIGDTVCLNANTGANLTYQWRLNTNPIVGANGATYCAGASGTYSVTVTNGSNCSINSNAVVMTFNPRPTASISYTTPVTFCEGGAVVLTGVSNNGISYQWQNNGSPLAGATNSNYLASSTGSYSVIITNGFGCSATSPTILVVSNPLPQPVITRTQNILSTGSYATYQWYLNSQPISGANGQSHNATQNGGYAVQVGDVNGCVNYSSVMFLSNVGIGGTPSIAASSVKIFPNPVQNVVNIDAPAPVNVVLRDLTGRMLKQIDDVKQLDMSGLADGYYMLMISDRNGRMIKAEKVMKVAE